MVIRRGKTSFEFELKTKTVTFFAEQSVHGLRSDKCSFFFVVFKVRYYLYSQQVREDELLTVNEKLYTS